MLAGHIGAALALARVERRVNVGVFVTAALFLDILLWLFVLLGWESLSLPSNFAQTHQPEFIFPYSHSLAAGLVWSLVAALLAFAAYAHLGAARVKVALIMAVTVFSHWLLDALVHRPELPVIAGSATNVGLGLWQDMPVALVAEGGIVAMGLWLFVAGSTLSRGRLLALATLAGAIFVFTALGMTIAPAPPSAQAMALSSLITLMAICALAYWLGRPTVSCRAAVAQGSQPSTVSPISGH